MLAGPDHILFTNQDTVLFETCYYRTKYFRSSMSEMPLPRKIPNE